jgi:hypothetical protein
MKFEVYSYTPTSGQIYCRVSDLNSKFEISDETTIGGCQVKGYREYKGDSSILIFDIDDYAEPPVIEDDITVLQNYRK